MSRLSFLDGNDIRHAVLSRSDTIPPKVAHGWVRYVSGQLVTTCGQVLAPDEYEYFTKDSPITCITCLVKDSKK